MKTFLILLAAALAGYALFGKGFAYLGRAPLFVGEAVLAVGVAQLAWSGAWRAVPRSATIAAIVAFAAWGAARTLPYLPVHGMDALRDAVVWGYAAFALLVAAALRAEAATGRALALYAAWAPAYLIAIPALYLGFRFVEPAIPFWPGTDVPLVFLKAGDIGVHVGAAAAFLLLRPGARDGRPPAPAIDWAAWAAAAFMIVLLAAIKRAGFVAAVAALVVATALMPSWRALRPVALAAAVVAAVAAGGLTLDFGFQQRPLSPAMLGESLSSLAGETAVGHLDGPKGWRLEWWRAIAGYTVFGELFWTGRGFGVSLADADGFADNVDPGNRGPHSAHFNILARAGVPGLVLWGAVNLCFAAAVLRRQRRARRDGARGAAATGAWLLAAWAAFLANLSFDVYLEGPPGGIWYWSLVGFGIAWAAGPAAARRAPAGAPSRAAAP
ncbi:MAG: O-antigen ligase family protein [Rhodospirillaceae bacterium]